MTAVQAPVTPLAQGSQTQGPHNFTEDFVTTFIAWEDGGCFSQTVAYALAFQGDSA